MILKGSKQGFSYVEVILTIALVGIITSMTFPKMRGILESGKEKQAIVKTEALNAAKLCFKMRYADAESQFLNARDDEQRFLLLQKMLPNAEKNLREYVPGKYSMSFNGGLDNKVILKYGHKVISY